MPLFGRVVQILHSYYLNLSRKELDISTNYPLKENTTDSTHQILRMSFGVMLHMSGGKNKLFKALCVLKGSCVKFYKSDIRKYISNKTGPFAPFSQPIVTFYCAGGFVASKALKKK